MSSGERIGIIGIGAMGFAMATNLSARGRAPQVRDIDPKTIAAAAARGLSSCDSPAQLAERCDLVAIVVVDAKQIDEVLFGTGGVVYAQLQGRPLAVMICSTIAASDTERLRDRLVSHRIALL